MKLRPALMLFTLAMLALVTACASGGSGRNRPDPELLTREEIMSVDVTNLYDVVHRLRPRWLTADRRAGERSFGTVPQSIVVYQNQSLLGDVDVLRQWSPSSIYSMEWMDGPKASASLPGLGSRHVAGAIIIHTGPEG